MPNPTEKQKREEQDRLIEEGWINGGKLLLQFYKEQGEPYLKKLAQDKIHLSMAAFAFKVLMKRKLVEEVNDEQMEEVKELTTDHDPKNLARIARAIKVLEVILINKL